MKNSRLLYFLFIHSLLKIFTEEQYRLSVDSPTRGVHFIIITPITIHDNMQSREKLSFFYSGVFLLVCHIFLLVIHLESLYVRTVLAEELKSC